MHGGRAELYAPGHPSGKARHTLGQSQSSGGSGDCEKRPCHRRRLPCPLRRDARRARRPGSLYGRPCRGYRLCYAGAMLPPGPTASLHAGADRKRRCPGGGWFPGPQPKGGGQGYRAAARCRRGSGKRFSAPGMRCPEPRLFPLYHRQDPLCRFEIRYDGGWQARRPHRPFSVDHRRDSPRPCPQPAQPVSGHFGGHRHHIGG